MNTKKCSTCKRYKKVSSFRRDKSQKDGLQSRCKHCASTKIKSLYTRKYAKKYRQRVKDRIDNNRRIISDIKKAIGCKFCNECEPVCLDFHHLDPAGKDINVGQQMSSGLERLKREIAKCICVCANCHRKVHAKILKI